MYHSLGAAWEANAHKLFQDFFSKQLGEGGGAAEGGCPWTDNQI